MTRNHTQGPIGSKLRNSSCGRGKHSAEVLELNCRGQRQVVPQPNYSQQAPGPQAKSRVVVVMNDSNPEGRGSGDSGLRLNLSLMLNTRQSTAKSAPSSVLRPNLSASKSHSRTLSKDDNWLPVPMELVNELEDDPQELRLNAAHPMRGASSSDGDVQMNKRKKMTPTHMEAKIWKFRGVMTEVAPGLFVGDVNAAKNLEALQQHGITHVLNCAAANIRNFHTSTDLQYMKVVLEDNPNEDIFCLFYDVVNFLEDAISTGGRVLIHCNYGISRSSSMAICYLMHARNWDYERALSHLKSVRSICEPNAGYVLSLMTWASHRQQPHKSLPRMYSIAKRPMHIPGVDGPLQPMRVTGLPVFSDSACLLFHWREIIYLWKGRLCSQEKIDSALKLIANLQKYEAASSLVVTVVQRQEPSEFREMFAKVWGDSDRLAA